MLRDYLPMHSMDGLMWSNGDVPLFQIRHRGVWMMGSKPYRELIRTHIQQASLIDVGCNICES